MPSPQNGAPPELTWAQPIKPVSFLAHGNLSNFRTEEKAEL